VLASTINSSVEYPNIKDSTVCLKYIEATKAKNI